MLVFFFVLGLIAFLSSDVGKASGVVIAKGLLGLIGLCFSSVIVVFIIMFVVNLMLR
jgi:hypothetical protein